MEWLFRLLRLDQDSLRETRIELYRQKMLTSNDAGERRIAWLCMQKEMQNRSPEQLERMEKASRA